MGDHTSTNLASNLRRLREARGLTQKQLSELAEVPRPTLANLESGAANPTLAVLVRVAGALQSSLEQLVAAPRAGVRHYARSTLKTQGRGRATGRQLLQESIPGVFAERWQLAAGGRMSSPGATPGFRYYLTCESGELECRCGRNSWRVEAGDVIVVDAGSACRVVNPGRGSAVAYAFTTPAPAGG